MAKCKTTFYWGCGDQSKGISRDFRRLCKFSGWVQHWARGSRRRFSDDKGCRCSPDFASARPQFWQLGQILKGALT